MSKEQCSTPNYAADKLRSFIRETAPAQCRVLSRGDDCDCLLCCVDRLVAPHAALTEFMRLFEDGVIGTTPEVVSAYNEAVSALPEPVFPAQCRSGCSLAPPPGTVTKSTHAAPQVTVGEGSVTTTGATSER